MKSIRWNRKRNCFIFDTAAATDFAVESALDLSLTSLRTALARQGGISVPPIASLPSPEVFKNYSAFADSMINGPNAEIVFEGNEGEHAIFFHLTQQGHLSTHFAIERPRITDKGMVIEITQRAFGELRVLIQHLQYAIGLDDLPFWSFDIICNPRGRTVGSVWQAYRTLYFTLTTLPEDLTKSVKGVQLALQLGRPEVLIGSPESSWLEVKEYDYRLSSWAEKIKLAQDLAVFANADGGLLVLGLRTSKSNDIDIISRVTPLPLPPRSVSQYRKTIDSHVYPLMRGLEVFTVPFDRGELLVISVPPQSDDDKPFVVYGNLGSITDGKVTGQFVSVVQRRGDGAEYLNGPALHSLLTARSRTDED